jgi:hypothetical protein
VRTVASVRLSVHLCQNAIMAQLALTAERRKQLAEWLEDPQRLRSDHPAVAEYFRTANALPGTDDRQADAAFDLRVLHYMTAGESLSANPYWEIVAPSVSERDGRRVVDGGSLQGSSHLAFAEMTLQAAYAYAIPSPETISWVSDCCDGRPVIEVGAGRGYWSAQLSRAGISVQAFELEPPDKSANVSFPRAAGQRDVWHPVHGIDELDFGDRAQDVLFLCWPPGWGNSMASDVLGGFESAGGDRLIYIGEPKGGKTGDDAFFDRLSAGWRLATVDADFVSWWDLADVAEHWVRA